MPNRCIRLLSDILTRQLNTSFRPQRSEEPESIEIFELLDSRLRGNDKSMHQTLL
jgi:hypothetical protein